MADPARQHNHEPPTAAAPDGATERERPPTSRWQELRTLLLDAEHRRIDAVEAALADPQLHADAVSRVLPEAVARRGPDDHALGAALGPIVGEAIKTSVRRDPQPLVEAIFPIMGPAIRRAIATAFAELIQSLNSALEHSFTPRGIAWRIEAARTGKSFGEVVLRHSLVYRVEQLFVIHPESGLLIEHRTSPGVQALSPDMVAGMLTAIVDFARDSFHVSRQEGIDALELGELTVWIERGPIATLAAVIRGRAPVGYRQALQRAVEDLHRVHAEDINRSTATGQRFEVRADILDPCLGSQLQRPAAPSRWRVALLALAVALAIGWCAGPRVIEGRRFDRYLQALRGEPGIVVGSAGRIDGRFAISGMRDPIARDPGSFLRASGLDSTRVDSHWEPYIALRPDFIAKRARLALQAPAEVQLTVRTDTLVLAGVASEAWRSRAAGRALSIAGVSALDSSALRDSIDVALQLQVAAINAVDLPFALGETELHAELGARLDSLARALQRVEVEGRAHGRTVTAQVRGFADSAGTPAFNTYLRLARARTIRRRLVAAGVSSRVLTATADSANAVRRTQVVVTVRPSP